MAAFRSRYTPLPPSSRTFSPPLSFSPLLLSVSLSLSLLFLPSLSLPFSLPEITTAAAATAVVLLNAYLPLSSNECIPFERSIHFTRIIYPIIMIIMVVVWWVFPLIARTLGECSTIHSPPALFFFKVEINLRVLIPLFTPGLVHSGAAN